MAVLDPKQLAEAIAKAGHSWVVRTLPPNEPPHALGWQPSPPEQIQKARLVAEQIARVRLPNLSVPRQTSGEAAASAAAPSAGPELPNSSDWRSRGGVIGPVRDQRWCGSCVSFATTGLVGAMAGIELGAVNLELSEADQHFCSSHGANCGGWNNGDALNQVKIRGVMTDTMFPYMTAFDNPPVGDPNDPEHLWIAHCRP